MSELQAAYLYAQFEQADRINQRRLFLWQRYQHTLQPLQAKGLLTLPSIPHKCCHNAHLFYLKVSDLAMRTALIAHLRACGILAVFHYVPLHSATAGKQFGRFVGEDRFTTKESERLVRLPLFFNLSDADQAQVIAEIHHFFDEVYDK